MAVSLTSVARVIDMPPALKSVLREACDFANDQGLFFADVDSMMAATNLAERTVQMHMRTLERMGVLLRSMEPLRIRGRLVKSRVYVIDLAPAILEFGTHPELKMPEWWNGPTDRAADSAGDAPQDETAPGDDNENIDNARLSGDIHKPDDGERRRCTPEPGGGESPSPATASRAATGAGDSEKTAGRAPNPPETVIEPGARAQSESPSADSGGVPDTPVPASRAAGEVDVSDTPVAGDTGTGDGSGDGTGSDASKETVTERWRRHEPTIIRAFGEAAWNSWLKPMMPIDPHKEWTAEEIAASEELRLAIEAYDREDEMWLGAPTRFITDYVRTHHTNRLGSIVGGRVRIIYSQKSAARLRREQEKQGAA